jgi:hypothetical protein
MTTVRDQDERERIAKSGQQIYEHLAATRLRPEDDGKFIAIDIDSGAFEVDPDDFSATERLLHRQPNARMWLGRVGRKAAYRLGTRLIHKESK